MEGTSDRGSDGPSDEDFVDFLGLLNELKSTGCNLLVVGDVRRGLFARASAHLLGDAETVRYRLLATTDVSARSVAERLPEPDRPPRPLAETTRLVDHVAVPRSAAAATANGADAPGALGTIPERRVTDSDLDGLRSALSDGIDDLTGRAGDLRPAELRIGVDSLTGLLDFYDEDAVRRCLRDLGGEVDDRDAMAHYVLRAAYDSDVVRRLSSEVDAVIELRSVDPDEYGHDAQQRWHVPGRDLTMDWVRL